MERLKVIIGKMVFFLITVFVPVFFEYAYFNMSQAKAHIYMLSIFLLLFLAGILCLIGKAKTLITKEKAIKEKLLLPEKLIIVFAILALISALLSERFVDAFLGLRGWGIGAYTIFTLMLAYFILSRWMGYKEKSWRVPYVVFGIILIIGILHSCGIDVLLLHDGIYEKQWYEYLSTIGHKNWYVGFLCLLTPLFACGWIGEEDQKSEIIYGILLELALFNVILCDSDGVYLGLFVSSLFAMRMVVMNQAYLIKALEMFWGFGIGLFVIALSPCFSEKRAVMSGISKGLLALWSPLLTIIASSFLLCFLHKRILKEETKKKVLISLRIIFILAALIYLGYVILSFDDSFGSYRGQIWRTAMNCFKDFSIKDKLFGIGPEMLYLVFGGLSETRGMLVLVAHSELLQVLLTMGLLGILCWLSFWGSLIHLYLKDKMTSYQQMMFFLPMMAYLGQSLVNSGMTTNVALLYLIGAMLRCKIKTFGNE